jgi:hypothetical protein
MFLGKKSPKMWPNSNLENSILTFSVNLLKAKIKNRPNDKNSGHLARRLQGCQMVYFQTKNPNLGKFWRTLHRKILIYRNGHLEYFKNIWDIL